MGVQWYKSLVFFSVFMTLNCYAQEELEPLDVALNEVTSSSFDDEGNASTEVQLQKSDAEILQSLNNLGNQLDNDIFLIERQGIDELFESEQVNEDKLLVDGPLSEVEFNENDMLLQDNFDDLNIELAFDELETSEAKIEFIEEQLELTTPAKSQAIKTGVGVDGKEETIINSLDHSDLMDFDSQIDVWSEDVIEDIEDIEDIEGLL